MNPMPCVVAALIALGAVFSFNRDLPAADWPNYRHDLARSGATEEPLATPLHRQWVHRAAHPPRPAWPEPGREVNRLAFDYAYEVTAAGGRVYFGSSADHKVYAIDLQSGRPLWSFFTEGPVRFAPAIEGGRVFVASDDGWLYCLSADNGVLLWRFHGGPRDERMIGNQQMISRWPLRSGVAVEDGTVYFSAGMWPSEGVYLYALAADGGKVLWKNETSGVEYLDQPHPPSDSMTGVAPQGYVLGSPDQLFLPTGRNVPAAYDRKGGELLYYHSRPTTWGDRWGGSWSMLASGLLFSWRCDVLPDCNVELGECMPDKDDGIIAFDAKSGSVRRDFPGKRCAVVHGDTIYLSGSGKIDACDLQSWTQGKSLADGARWSATQGRTYAMILAGNTLFAGGYDSATAFAADTGRKLWHDHLESQARGLAAAGGRLLVSTTAGEIICYGPEPVDKPAVVPVEAESPAFAGVPADSPAAAAARRVLQRSAKKAGHCLVLGAGDGQFLYWLAKQSDLQISCVEPDEAKVARARRVLDEARLYGVRIAVHHGSLRDVAYPDFFADLIVGGDAGATDWEQVPAGELYRVLRPCGGTAYLVAGNTAGQPQAIAKRFEQASVPPSRIAVSDDAVVVERGPLPGAGDWTHQYANAARTGTSADQRVRLPLRLLWFGEPGPERLIARHWKGPAPLSVNGRMFVIGQYSLMAVDAYNGRGLWRREFPEVARFPATRSGGNAAADDDSVYLATDDACLRLDAATGETLQTYQVPRASFGLPGDASRPAAWSGLAVGTEGVLGSIGNIEQSKGLFLFSKAGELLWTYTPDGLIGSHAVSMDAGKVYLIQQAAPDAVARAKRRGENAPSVARLVALDAANGKPLWQTEDGVAGRTELWLSGGVLLATGSSGMSGYEASSGDLLYSRGASMRRLPVIVGNTIYGEPAAYDLQTGQPKHRRDPLSTEQAFWNFSRSYGCGSIAGAPNLLLFRSGTLGMYDLAGDTGTHNFGGVRAGCHINAIAAAGLVLMPPGDASCTCSYCFQTTVALVPTTRRENWSVFYERLPSGPVRRAALNLGAPGDQRDGQGTLWLGEPRPQTVNRRRDIAVPFRLAGAEGFGPYHANADRVEIAGTDRPWIYTSGWKGPLRAELDLEILDRGFTSWPVKQEPDVDGRDVDPCWDRYKAVAVASEDASVTLRHDDRNLYVAYRRPAVKDSAGEAVAWNKSATGGDSPVWNDDSFELFLCDAAAGRGAPSRKYLHLGISASGAKYDALWTYVTPTLPDREIPRIEAKIDGEADDWSGKGLQVVSLPGSGGAMRPASDFDPVVRVGWNEDGVVMLIQVRDNAVRPAAADAPLDNGDSVEVWLTPQRGSSESYRLVVAAPADSGSPAVRSEFRDARKALAGEKLGAEIAAKRAPDGYLVELCLPWKNLKMSPAVGTEFGLQLLLSDDDGKGEKNRFQAFWHPAGDPGRDPLACQTLRLAVQPGAPIKFTRSAKRNRSGLHTAVPPYPFPIAMPPLGAEGEDTGYAGTWSGNVKGDDAAIVAELAIPWKTLADAGLHRDRLMLNVSHRGTLREPPVLGREFERLIVVPPALAGPKTVSVRLHFAELDGAKPGERVFDVTLQNQTVLKDFDIAAAAQGSRRAVVKQFDGVIAARAVTLQLLPKSKQLTTMTAPTLCGIEILPP